VRGQARYRHAGRIRVLGRGKSAYRDTNETTQGRAKNRRAEVRYQDEAEGPAPRGGAGAEPKLHLVGANGAEEAA
jgi:hypothetical protein